ncbi:alcohol dehydrogenase [mine drainage metagenome]|uniref:Alcohol dehydrogenase n=1 Tax=mine drainage metagenome TaxID=410659 RepID=A0A1J5QFH5_9ZZZZ
MKAFHIQATTGLDGLVMKDLPEPRPGPGQVLVRVRARSVNFRDIRILNGLYPVPARLGVVALSDGAGEVVEVGSGVTQLAVGDRVMGIYFPQWLEGRFAMRLAAEQFGCTRDGMLAPLIAVEESALVKVPPHLTFEEAATLPCAAVTAWSALVGPRPILPGEAVLTVGSGGVALFGLQFAKLFGAQVIAITSSEDKVARLTQLGAGAVVNSSATPEWSSVVREMTNGRGVDHVLETGGLGTLPRSIAATAEEGMVNVVAALDSGAIDVKTFRNPIIMRRTYVGSRANFERMNRAICANALRPVIDRSFAFSDAREALEYSNARGHFGKIVINDD